MPAGSYYQQGGTNIANDKKKARKTFLIKAIRQKNGIILAGESITSTQLKTAVNALLFIVNRRDHESKSRENLYRMRALCGILP